MVQQVLSDHGASDRTPSQPQQVASTSYESPGRISGNHQGSLTSGPDRSARLQHQWGSAQRFSQQNLQQINTGFMPGSQTLWPPGSLPYMQPQVFVYPNPPGFYPQPVPGSQRPLQQIMPQVGMMLPPQQYPGVNPMFPYGATPSPTPEQWMHARNLRPPPAVFQGVRPMGWGGVPFQSPNDPRWRSAPQPLAASMPLQRPSRPSTQRQPPPPPQRTASFPQLAQMDRPAGQASHGPFVSESQQSSSASAMHVMAPQTEKQEQAASGADSVEAARPSPGKVPCAFFLKTGTCAYGDKCKFEHPWDKLPVVQFNSMGLPLRQGQPECAYYLRHGRCGFGPSCKFHHPEPAKAGSTASQEQPATTATAAVADAVDPAAIAPFGPEAAGPQADAGALPQAPEQQPDQSASPAALSPQSAPSPASTAHVVHSESQRSPPLALLPPQYVMTPGGAQQAPQLQAPAQHHKPPQLQLAGQSSSMPHVQLPTAEQLQPQGQTLPSPTQASQLPHAMPGTPQLLTASMYPQAMTQNAVLTQPPAGIQQGVALQPQLQPTSQVATAWLPATTLQPLPVATAAAEQLTAASQPPLSTAPQTSAFLPMASVAMQPQLGLHQNGGALPSMLRQRGHVARRSASVPEGSLPTIESLKPGLPTLAAPANLVPYGGLPMVPSPPHSHGLQEGLMPQPQQFVPQPQQLVTQLPLQPQQQPQQLVSQPQVQQLVTQPQAQLLMTQPQIQQLVTQPQVQQLMTQPQVQQFVTQPQPQLQPQLQPQQLVAQGHQQGTGPQAAPAVQAAAGLPLLQQQPVVLAQGQIMQPAQQGLGPHQAAPGSMVSVQMPAQAMVPLQASSAQTLPLLLPPQPLHIIPSQGLTAGAVQILPKAGLTPLEQVPKQASSPPSKAGEGDRLEDMSAGLPSLHLTEGTPAPGLEDLSGEDVLKPLGHFGSEELAAPSLSTPAPSERSLATASTISTSTSLISSHTSSSDTAKAIEAVRQSLEAKESKGAKDNVVSEHSCEQAQTELAK